METNAQKMLKSLSPKKVIVPVVLGLGAIIYLMLADDKMDFKAVKEAFSSINLWWVGAALIVLVLRDAGYTRFCCKT